MTKEAVSIISTAANLLLTIAKFVFGILINSTALIAEAIHSALDIFSSLTTFIGIRTAKKPVDKEHPYGYYRAESLAGFVVVILLAASAIWILYEGIVRLFNPEDISWTLWALVLMAVSIIINEIMARLKFYYGNKFSSLALVADAEHSRADVISSLGVLIGLALIKFWPLADAVLAILIGIYILWESWQLGRQTTDALLDVNDPESETKIREICKNQNLDISELKTRKISAYTLADLKVKFDPRLKIDQVAELTEKLQNQLTAQIENLKSVNIAAASHEYSQGLTKPSFGGPLKIKRGFELIPLKKLGYRIIVPEDDGLSHEFGSPYFMVIDKNPEGKILRKEKIKNKFFQSGAGHGVKFAKAISADEVYAVHIGENAQKNLKANEIKFKIINSPKELEKLLSDNKTD